MHSGCGHDSLLANGSFATLEQQLPLMTQQILQREFILIVDYCWVEKRMHCQIHVKRTDMWEQIQIKLYIYIGWAYMD